MVKETQLPRGFVYAVIAICVLPFLLNIIGVSFASASYRLDFATLANLTDYQLLDKLYYALSGSFNHTVLEWVAICTAFFTGILSFVHFAIKRDVVTPIIGVSLLFAGTMDAFHILAADRMIQGAADNHALVPVTWAICRLFNAVILILGVVTVLILKPKKGQGNFNFVAIFITCFGLLASVIIYVAINTSTLPQTIFPNAWIKRPWDLTPLLLFIFAGIFIFPRFYRHYPSLFSYALVISTIPAVATQMHMTFGSTALFDNHFNIGHFLKIIAYLVPFVGLSLDYVQTYRQEAMVINTLATSSTLLSQTVENQEKMALQQSATVNQTTKTMNDLVTSSQQSLQQTEIATDRAKKVLNLAEIGTEAVNHTLMDMANLQQRVKKIAEQIILLSEQTALINRITSAVTSLANQTNLLALNSSIEASRNGANGQGFEVIAKEIRQLADQSKKYSQEINHLVANIEKEINSTVIITNEGKNMVAKGVQNAQFTADTFMKVAKEINMIVATNQKIYLTYNEQENAIQQVMDAMTALNQGVTQTAMGMRDTKVGIQEVEKALLFLSLT